MGRKAGDSDSYQWRLYDKSVDGIVKTETIDLPTVTTIIKKVLAKHLGTYESNMTLDLLAAALDAIGDDGYTEAFDTENGMTIWDQLTDGEILSEWLREQGLTNADVLAMRGDEGHVQHDTFEALGVAHLSHGEDFALERAEELVEDPSTPWDESIGGWWLEERPKVLAPEQTVRWFSGRGAPFGFAGTLDLAYTAKDGATVITDLKSRNYGGDVYDSDRAQLGGLKLAYEQHKGKSVDRLLAFIALPAGEWKAKEVDAAKWVPVFEHLFEIYELTQTSPVKKPLEKILGKARR